MTAFARPLVLGGEFFPDHGANKMAHEGDVVGARRRFLANRPNNLRFLLEKRFGWMNDYIKPGMNAIELGSGAGFLGLFVEAPVALSDVEPRPWTSRVVDAMQIGELDEQFDIVVCSHMIHHLASPLAFFEQLAKAVKPGGLVLINEIHTSLSMRFLLWLMRHEGWSYDVDVFDRAAVANDPRDPWSANCAIPQLLWHDRQAFERAVPAFAIERFERNECAIFPLSGGVIAKTRTINLPDSLLKAVDWFDGVLIKLAPETFAMASRLVLRRV
ncbi:MAG: class I SAM-dependent methyltransferase [Polymorphobacter sp.]